MSSLPPAEPPEALQLRSFLGAVREDWSASQANLDDAGRMARLNLPEDARAAAAATYLMRAYTGIEELFQRIADLFDGGAPSGSAWHRELLAAMGRQVPGSRPPVISGETLDQLDEYRRFRHRVTHAYGRKLEWSKMHDLVERLPSLRTRLGQDLAAFEAFVEQLISELENRSADPAEE